MGVAKRGQRRDEGPRCRAVHVPGKPKRRPIPASADVEGHGHHFRRVVDQPELRVSSRVSPRLVVLPFHPSVTRRATSYELDPQLVSSWLSRLRGQIRSAARGTLGRQNRHALQSGDRLRPCQLRKNRRCPRGVQCRPEGRIDSASGASFTPPKPHIRLSHFPARLPLIRDSPSVAECRWGSSGTVLLVEAKALLSASFV